MRLLSVVMRFYGIYNANEIKTNGMVMKPRLKNHFPPRHPLKYVRIHHQIIKINPTAKTRVTCFYQ